MKTKDWLEFLFFAFVFGWVVAAYANLATNVLIKLAAALANLPVGG